MADRQSMVYLPLADIHPYENNPRKNKEAIKKVAASIAEFGAQTPMILDKDHVIIAGHTRYEAAKKLKLNEFPCIIAENLSEEQVKAYRLADNKTSEFSEWDEEKLIQELQSIINIDMEDFGFVTEDELEDEEENPYSTNVKIPQYEPTGSQPMLAECFSTYKADELIKEIEATEGLTEGERTFLKWAAYRHTQFNYKNIAEYYCHAIPEVQRLMEKSALVIIDMEDAIANGYCKLASEIKGIAEDEYGDE